jgi:DHA1 family multidrug resistance protein-like MFS transporter
VRHCSVLRHFPRCTLRGGSGSVVAAVAWFRIPETRGSGLARLTSLAELPSFGQQIRLMSVSAGFLLVSLIGFAAAVARTGAVFNVIPLMVTDRLGLAPDQIGLWAQPGLPAWIAAGVSVRLAPGPLWT